MEGPMKQEWSELTRRAAGEEITVERIRLAKSGIAIEGEFSLPLLARLSLDDQVFVMAFVGSHGSITDMERLFGISYPSVKNRLNSLASQLKMVEVERQVLPEAENAQADTLSRLERGEITAAEALERLGSGK
jgi:hypothetical protein